MNVLDIVGNYHVKGESAGHKCRNIPYILDVVFAHRGGFFF